MLINETLQWAKTQLDEACERPLFEAELLLSHHLNKERIYLHLYDQEEVNDIEGYQALVARRAAHEPYEYIVGKADFYDITLEVEQGVLIPRPETEILVDRVAEIIEREKFMQIAEIGVGSGAISIMLARKFPELKIIATDICETPIHISRKNIESFGLSDRIEVLHSNLINEVSEPIELVVSNPPYIAEDFVLDSNVVDYEPKEALFSGRVGDELLKQIIDDVHARGIRYLACEMGYDQKLPIEAYVKNLGVEYIEFYADLAGHDRGFVVKFA